MKKTIIPLILLALVGCSSKPHATTSKLTRLSHPVTTISSTGTGSFGVQAFRSDSVPVPISVAPKVSKKSVVQLSTTPTTPTTEWNQNTLAGCDDGENAQMDYCKQIAANYR